MVVFLGNNAINKTIVTKHKTLKCFFLDGILELKDTILDLALPAKMLKGTLVL